MLKISENFFQRGGSFTAGPAFTPEELIGVPKEAFGKRGNYWLCEEEIDPKLTERLLRTAQTVDEDVRTGKLKTMAEVFGEVSDGV